MFQRNVQHLENTHQHCKLRKHINIKDSLSVPPAENNTRVGLARSMASAGARAYNGGLGADPPAGVQGSEPPVGVRWAKPP